MPYAYTTIRDKLQDWVQSGQLAVGDRLPTIKHLASQYSVSIRTVQQAVKALCKDGILEARPKRGIVVKAVFRDLRERRQFTLISPWDVRKQELPSYAAAVVKALKATLSLAGYGLTFLKLRGDSFQDAEGALRKTKPGGLLLYDLDNEEFVRAAQRLGYPTVSVDRDYCHFGIASIVFDHLRGIFLATRRLLDLGHERIHFIHGLNPYHYKMLWPFDQVERERVHAYRLAMLDAGLPYHVHEFLAASNPFAKNLNRLTWSASIQEMMSLPERPTAVVCHEGWAAMRLCEELKNLGYDIPSDVSVAGYGNDAVRFRRGKRIASVHVDLEAMGEMAARQMIVMARDRNTWPGLHVVGVQFEEHDSLAAPSIPTEANTRKENRTGENARSSRSQRKQRAK